MDDQRAFLRELLAFESGIDPSRLDWYRAEYDQATVRFPRVTGPGQLARDPSSGEPIFEMVTLREYFERLGVSQFLTAWDTASLERMQYASVNPWGFVGYQIGEAALIDAGYYLPAVRTVLVEGALREVPAFYRGDVQARSWANGVQECLVPGEAGDAWVLATHVNSWSGRFLGKDGIDSFEALRTERGQQCVMMELMARNARQLLAGLRAAGALPDGVPLPDALSKLGPTRLDVAVSWAGLLAACHLCGTLGTLDYLLRKEERHDELGTSASSYIQRFSRHRFELEALERWASA